ncbi:hypothetical protein [Aestuariivivens sediminis]|uniref:hypothetical protein n=1 Tax=Aestuariivivens sediminis TaxID=2913557 RepID=UPI001F5713E5|nr:hypothetical protein [Aestuariivivens sediminis]
MKTTNQFFSAIVMLLLIVPFANFAQEDARPAYVTVTKSYWNNNYEGSPEEWKAAEKEYMEKVTKKNEHISWAGYFMHLMTEHSNEVIYAQSYPSWDAIDKAAARNAELEKEAWPNDDERSAFLKKLGSAYSLFHSDEIYATMSGAKPLEGEVTEDMILYVRQNKMAFPEGGSMDEWDGLYNKVVENVIKKNEYLKAYYPERHAWGSDRRDFNEVMYVESMCDLEKMLDKHQELMGEALTSDERKALNKYFKSHGDYLYSPIKL